VVIYGSYLTNDFIPSRSDIDIAVITQKKNEEINLEIWNSLLGKTPSVYDIRIFELLPLYIKMEIINHHLVLFGDPLEISEYFYYYRKIWKDMEHRIRNNQFENIKKKIKLMKNRKKFL
jgi:predicted nucleotidyltransferase